MTEKIEKMDSMASVFLDKPLERTLGDGIDNSLLEQTEAKYKSREKNKLLTFLPVEPKPKIFTLKPVYIPKERKQPKYLIRKPKEPKFIPYEPYKAATEPIIPHKVAIKRNVLKQSKSNVDIQDLVSQMAEIRATELSKHINQDASLSEENSISLKQWEKEKLSYETDIKNLRETNSHLENQIKFQAQVNSELKTLLVAAVGEDLETRVQHLTEDKLQLARALLNSANHITTHQEQTEWLSGQCEVWRSKFLASSLMVEELARWKSALSTRITELQETTKKLLDERYRIQKKSLKTYCFLQEATRQMSKEKEEQLRNANIIELSNINLDLAQQLSAFLKADKENVCEELYERYLNLPQHTNTEKIAINLLQNPVSISNKQDAICSALVGTAMSLSGDQVYLKYPSNEANCCKHCTGEIKNI